MILRGGADQVRNATKCVHAKVNESKIMHF